MYAYIKNEENDGSKSKCGDYGKGVLKELAERLTREFGNGVDESNLRYMRLFYINFPIRDTLRLELTSCFSYSISTTVIPDPPNCTCSSA